MKTLVCRFEKLIWCSIVTIVVLLLVSTVPAWAVTYLSGPATLSRSGETYVVNQNFSCSGTAFTISAGSVVLDLGGHTVTYGTSGADNSYGVSIRQAVNAEVKNGTLTQASGSSGLRCHGIFGYGCDNTNGPRLHDLTINTHSTGSGGINLDYCGYGVQIYNNTLNISNKNVSISEVCAGIALLEDYYGTSGKHGLVHHNVINGSSRGIDLEGNVSYVDVYSNEIHHVAPPVNAKGSYGIFLLQGSNHNRMFDNVVATSRGMGICLEAGCTYNEIYGNTVDVGDDQSGEWNRAYGIRLRYGDSYNKVHDNKVTVRNVNNNETECFYMGDNAWEADSGVPVYNEIYNNTFTMLVNDEQGGARSCVGFAYTGAGNQFHDNTLITNIQALEFLDHPAVPIELRHNTVQKGPAPIADWRTLFVWGNGSPGGPHDLIDTVCGSGVSLDDVQWGSNGGSYDVGWSLTVAVTDGKGTPISGAAVTIQDKTGAAVYTGATDGGGKAVAALRQYTQATGGKTNYTPHTVKATKAGYTDGSATVTVDATKQVALTLGGGSSVTLRKQANPTSTVPSGVVTFTITYSNDTGSTIYNAVVTDAVPSAMTYVPGSAKLNGETISPDPYQNGSVVVSLGNVAAGASGTITFQATVN